MKRGVGGLLSLSACIALNPLFLVCLLLVSLSLFMSFILCDRPDRSFTNSACQFHDWTIAESGRKKEPTSLFFKSLNNYLSNNNVEDEMICGTRRPVCVNLWLI